ncbi:MAG: hypothetical protein OXL34_02810 [Gemmatimonadota bacterium]|nr:hypothetical protein [Gemmatimonadota bacterium]
MSRWIAVAQLLSVVNLAGWSTAQAQHTARAESPRNAYLDETAHRLVLGVRATRDAAVPAIDSYTALIRERMGVTASLSRRAGRLAHGESVTRVRWSRDEPEVARVLGSRFRTLGFGSGGVSWQVAFRRAADPLGDPFAFGFAVLHADSVAASVRSPLGADSERFYQFRSGDTISVELAGGRSIKAVEVTAIPRFRSIQLVAGVMWIEPESFGLVRVAYRLAKKLDSELGLQFRRGDGPNMGLAVELGDGVMAWDSATSRNPGRLGRFLNGAVNNLLPQWEMNVTAVVADYALWEMRHWLPRAVKWVGYLGVVDEVHAEGFPDVVESISHEWVFEIEQIRERGAERVAGVPETALEAMERWREDGDSITGEVYSTVPGEMVVIIPGDESVLATSDQLPPPIWDESIGGVGDYSIEEMESRLATIGTVGEVGDVEVAACPCQFEPPIWTLRLLRYNSEEGLSAGTRAWWSRGRVTAVATVRMRTAYWHPDVSLTAQHHHPQRRLRVSLYRNVSPFRSPRRAPWTTPDPRTSDLARYIAASGVGLQLLPGKHERTWVSLRVFREWHTVLGTAAEGVRTGASVRLLPWWGGLSDQSVGGGGEIMVRGSIGDNTSVSASATGALTIPLGVGWSGGLEAGGARIWGDPADYDLWSLGGTGDRLRGYSAGALVGRSFWRGRAELQRSLRYVRMSLFADWASVGRSNLYSGGVGAVLMEGLIRIDLARGLTSLAGGSGSVDAGWQIHWRADSFF